MTEQNHETLLLLRHIHSDYFHGNVMITEMLSLAVFNLGLQQRGPTGPIQPKIGGHLEKEGALT